MKLEETLAAETCSGRLRNFRLTYRDVRAQAIAAATGVGRTKLSSWENYPEQLEKARAMELQHVCDFLGCSVSWVLTGQGSAENEQTRAARDADLMARAYVTARHLEKVHEMPVDQAGKMLAGLYDALQQQDAVMAPAVAPADAPAPTTGRQIPIKLAAVGGVTKEVSGRKRASRKQAS